MKELNRRAFLTLTGAALAMMALAACGADDVPAAPAAPSTTDEAKVLTVLNLYREKAGISSPLTLDNGLKPAVELVVKIAKGEMKFDEEAMKALAKAEAGYDGVCAPIGIAFDKDTGNMMPVCVYSENAELMAQNLSLQLDEGAKASLSSPAITLVNIKTFELSGVTYWVAVVAEGKVKP